MKQRLCKEKTCKQPIDHSNALIPYCVECAMKRSIKNVAREKAKKAKEAKKKDREFKKKVQSKDVPRLKKKLEDEINRIARAIDFGYKCLACGKGQLMYASHYHSVGSNGSIRYHLENIWNGCFKCNGHNSSNREGYDKGLVSCFGKEYQQYVHYDLVKNFPYIKWNADQLNNCIRIAREIANRLESIGKTYTLEERVSLRQEFNKQIGIYV